MSMVPAAPKFQVLGSRHLPGWLAEQRVSLAFTTYQSGKLFLIGLKPDGHLGIFERTFNRAMGLWGDGQTIWMSSAFQLWRFENILAPGQTENGFDRMYVPRFGYTTGDLDIHDVAVDAEGVLVFINTLFSCLATISDRHSFKPLWRPPFVSKLAAEDRCHLNGLALKDGRPAYLTACGQTDVVDGWRTQRQNGGCVIDVQNNRVVIDGLSMPHSPRWQRDQLWLLNSGTGYLGTCDLNTAKFEPRVFCPGYARGLGFVGDFAVVGVSKPRRDGTFGGLKLDENLAQRKAQAQCGLLIIDLRTGDIVHWLWIEGVVEELYDVVPLPGVVRPTALGFKTDDIRYTVTIDGERSIWRAKAKT